MGSKTEGAQGAMAVGGILGIAGTLQDGQAQYRAAKYNAELDRVNARYTREQGAYEANLAEVEGKKVVGQMTASYGASGVTISGSAFDAIEESSRNARMDVFNIRLQSQRQARGLEMSAEQKIKTGKQLRNASYLRASGQLLQSGAQVASMGA